MKIYLFILASMLVFCVKSQYIPVVLPCTEDTYVESGSSSNNGSSSTLSVQGIPTVKRIYVKYDIASLNIPSNAVIVSAQIRLTIISETSNNVTTFTTRRVLSDWNDAMIYTNQPTLESSDQTSHNSYSSTHRSISVLNQVRNIIIQPSLNKGFCIYKSNETTSGSFSYSAQPDLLITYYIPINITNAIINYASTTASTSDGSITPIIANGPSGIYTYNWYKNGSASSFSTLPAVTGLGHGWYGLKVTDGASIFYYSFIVGVKCQQVDVNYNPGPEYVEDLSYSETPAQALSSNSLTSSAGYSKPGIVFRYGTLMKFKLWISPEVDITQAYMNMFGASHSGISNASILYQNTQNFDEIPVYYGTYVYPNILVTGAVTIPHKSTSTANASNIDIKHFWNNWKLDNCQNYGMRFLSSTSSGSTSQIQTYHSSDATTVGLRPNIQFKVLRECNLQTFSKLRRELDASYAIVESGELNFYFEEEYRVENTKFLPYKIFNSSGQLIAHVNEFGIVLLGSVLPIPYLTDEYNRTLFVHNLGLTVNKQYLLEVTLINGEKRFLKFIYKN